MLRSPANPRVAVTWSSLPGKPVTFPPSAHSHAWSDITGKPTTFPPAAHTHSFNDLADKPTIPAGNTLVGTVTLGQTATVAIALGIREVTVALTGAVKGQRYIAFCDSYRLNGGASVVGRPTGYAIVDCVSNTDGQVTVSINAPLLAIGQSYAFTCSIVRVNV